MGHGNGGSRLRTGERLRSLRRHVGVSRAEAARRTGVSRLQLAAYERGARPVPETVVASLARAYGVSPGEVVPSRSHSKLRLADGELTAGDVSRPLPTDASPEEVLDRYLDLIRELRGAGESDDLTLRGADLAALAEWLGGTPKEIERRLVELIHCTQEEARAIRRALLRRRLVVPAAGFVLGMGGLGSAAALNTDVNTAPAVADTERARTVDLGGGADQLTPPERAPAPPAEQVAPSAEPPTSPPANSGGESVTRSGSGEGGDWAEVIPPVVIAPE